MVTVTGTTNAIFKAYSLVCAKMEDEEGGAGRREGGAVAGKEGLTLRLVVPASQCGSLIGKGGSKIKEIREVTKASVQVCNV